MPQTTTNTVFIEAKAAIIYNAFADPKALETWMAPGNMTARIRHFDFSEGGGYEMSLFYPTDDSNSKGKTNEREDRYVVKFIELKPFSIIREAIHFVSDDPDFSGEMILEVTLDSVGYGTNVTFLFKNIPPGISPEDNEKGTIATLEKIARFTEIDEQYSDGSANAFDGK